jgi:hypothetical protein
MIHVDRTRVNARKVDISRKDIKIGWRVVIPLKEEIP